MPCFKGLAVSIHTPDGPLPEYSIQKQSRLSRIASYIPVPTPREALDGRTEQSTFAISITLLTPGQAVPYSRSQPSTGSPLGEQKYVSGLPGITGERGKYAGVIGPYLPITSSPNETVAAYIHFDGRTKEEVATLLRRGEETWVNSRWVSVPESEGGGLAEREFLFREVGLERWLNGLDLKGETKDVAARIERRKRRLEKRRLRRRKEQEDKDSDEEPPRARPVERDGVLRYGDSKEAPLESVSGDESMFTSDTDSDDEVPIAEAAGQIKVSLFRVLASGEVKRGEYSPQFDAHDDDDMEKDSGGGDADVDHTTTFAKPKTLDPKSISTQTVTGIDPPNNPYATFTFFYRGQKQLQKMGILPNPEPSSKAPASAKRKSKQLDASSLAPLKSKGTVGFTGYRDNAATSSQAFGKAKDSKNADPDEMDSDADGEGFDARKRKTNGVSRDEAEDDKEDKSMILSAEEVSRRGELADGVKKMQLKRQHSFDPPTPVAGVISDGASPDTQVPAPVASGMPPQATTSKENAPEKLLGPSAPPHHATHLNDISAGIGSPFKKQRASVSDNNPVSPLSFGAKGNDVSSMLEAPTKSSTAPSSSQSDAPKTEGFGAGSSFSSTSAAHALAADDKDEEL